VVKAALKPHLESKTFSTAKSFTFFREKEQGFVNNKLYQIFFVVSILLFSFLIFPESPRELGNICESHNSRKLCDVW